MPNEVIIRNGDSRLTVQWGKPCPCGQESDGAHEDPSVILTSSKAWEDPSGETGGWNVVDAWHLDADTINKLVPILRRASDQAYGMGAVEVTATAGMSSCAATRAAEIAANTKTYVI